MLSLWFTQLKFPYKGRVFWSFVVELFQNANFKFSVSESAAVFFIAFAQVLGRSTILNLGAGSESLIFHNSISIKKNSYLSSVC